MHTHIHTAVSCHALSPSQHPTRAQVLAELKEYAQEVDVDFVRKAVRAIGRCAIKVEVAAQRCVDTLLELIQTKVRWGERGSDRHCVYVCMYVCVCGVLECMSVCV